MGSSAKKKKQKAADFKKPKLRVGKARPKPDNFTDTSFSSKRIALGRQNLTITAPSASAQFSHHVSLLSSKSSTQRRDSLAYLTTTISSRPVNEKLLQPISALLPKLNPLMLDGSNGVRTQLLRVYKALPPKDIEPHVEQLLLYIRAGLTHLAADIRSSALDTLIWATEAFPEELVSCPGGWMKPLKCLLTILHWHAAAPSNKAGVGLASGGWISSKVTEPEIAGADRKSVVKMLNGLAAFLRAGLVASPEDPTPIPLNHGWPFPINGRAAESHMIPKRPNAFAHLNLFGLPRDEEGEMYPDREERQRTFHERFLDIVKVGVEGARKGGGEVGRAAAGVGKAVEDGMSDFKPGSLY